GNWMPPGGAGVRLGNDWGDNRLPVTSAERGAAGVGRSTVPVEAASSFGMAATVAPSSSSASVPTGSTFVANLLSIVSKMLKSKMLPSSWNEPAIIATMLAASRADLTRVATLLRMGGVTL